MIVDSILLKFTESHLIFVQVIIMLKIRWSVLLSTNIRNGCRVTRVAFGRIFRWSEDQME